MRVQVLVLNQNVNSTINNYISNGWEVVSITPQFGFSSDGYLQEMDRWFVCHLQHPNLNPIPENEN
jgi:hypothetical protein